MSEAAADMVNNKEKQKTEAVLSLVEKTGYKCSSGSSKKVKKGAWSAEEDGKLIYHVKAHGGKNWNSLPKEAGLNRSGRSCRFRWVNYLRPGLKLGKFSQDEEDLIMSLHNFVGNRWSQIAKGLPGRTDNEIKNHWRTHLCHRMLTSQELNLKQKSNTNPTTTHTSIIPTAVSCSSESDTNAFLDIPAASDLLESNPLGFSSEPTAKEDERMNQNFLDTESLDEQKEAALNQMNLVELSRLLNSYEEDVRLLFKSNSPHHP